MAVICAVTFMGCEKDEQESFKFDIENLYGTWQGIAIQSNGEWIDITQPPHTNLAFSVVFYENGTYSGSGYFGNGSGTYKAEGDIYLYRRGRIIQIQSTFYLKRNCRSVYGCSRR